MSQNVIHIENLSFGYSADEKVINGLNLHVPKGSIYGFLGINGAGKTTTLKVILRLIKSYEGNIFINGNDTKSNYPKYLKQVGSLIENPSFYSHLSANDNLKIWANYYQCNYERIPEVLNTMDLSYAAKKKTEHYSTGMKQRLGLAAALLHDPQLLILDEPTNGLDPMGIIDLRKVLTRLNDEGKTIVLSSHILSEVEKIVSHLGILQNGKLVYEGTIHNLHMQRDKNIEVTIEVDNSDYALQFIRSLNKKKISEKVIAVLLENKEHIPQLIKNLTGQGIKIYEIKQDAKDLESMFLSISQENPIQNQ